MKNRNMPAVRGAGMTFDEIAREMGCTRQRVQNLERSALKKLRRQAGALDLLRRMADELAAARGRRATQTPWEET